MIATEPNTEVVSFSAEPEWLDDVVRQLQDGAGGEAERMRCRGMARDILECGYIGADGRVQLFFSHGAYEAFRRAVQGMRVERGGLPRGHFAAMAIRDD